MAYVFIYISHKLTKNCGASVELNLSTISHCTPPKLTWQAGQMYRHIACWGFPSPFWNDVFLLCYILLGMMILHHAAPYSGLKKSQVTSLNCVVLRFFFGFFCGIHV